MTHDVIVVGARVAGAATALLLARAGRSVLLVDKATFPRDTLSTLYVQPPGVALLRRWGLLDELVASGCPPLRRISYQLGDVVLDGEPDGGVAYAPRRLVLDAILARAAVAAGVELRPGHTLRGVTRDDDGRVTGVELRGPDGSTVVEHAALVVGADGMRSTVAAAVGAATTVQDSPKTCVYYTFWPGVADHFELHEAPGRWIGAAPTHGGLSLVQAYFPQSEFPRVRADAMRAYLDNVRAAAPELYERMRAVEPAERLYGTGDQRNHFRAAAGPGWVLVGDAGHCKDSITARGISHAFLQAQLLADHVDGLPLDAAPALDAALARFGSARDAALVDDYRDTLAVARLAAPPHRVEMLREIGSDPQRVRRFFAAMAGVAGNAAPEAPDADRMIEWLRRARAARSTRLVEGALR